MRTTFFQQTDLKSLFFVYFISRKFVSNLAIKRFSNFSQDLRNLI